MLALMAKLLHLHLARQPFIYLAAHRRHDGLYLSFIFYMMANRPF
jgi:hypothetical protein